jgi:hypothetical protein
MKQIRFNAYCDTGFAGAIHEAELDVEVEDDATKEEIENEVEDALLQWAYQQIDCYFKIIEEKK